MQWQYWVMGVCVVGIVAAVVSLCCREHSSRSGELAAEEAFQRVRGRVLGEFLAKHRPGRNCLVLLPPALRDGGGRELPDLFLEGLQAGGGEQLPTAKVLRVAMGKPAAPKREPGQPEPVPMGQTTNREWTPERVQTLLEEAGAFDILVTAVPLPAACFSEAGLPQLPVLEGRELVLAAGYSAELAGAVQHGAILAALTYRRGARCDEKTCPEKTQEAFGKRYELVSSLQETKDDSAEGAQEAGEAGK